MTQEGLKMNKRPQNQGYDIFNSLTISDDNIISSMVFAMKSPSKKPLSMVENRLRKEPPLCLCMLTYSSAIQTAIDVDRDMLSIHNPQFLGLRSAIFSALY